MSRTVLSLWMVLVAGCVLVISRTDFTADLSAFLPRSPTPAQQILVEQLKDGVVSRLMLIGLSGQASALPAVSKALATRLRSDARFVSVDNGEDNGGTDERAYLWNNRYLLSPTVTPERFSENGLHAALQDDVLSLASPSGLLVRQIMARDPTTELLTLLDGLQGSTPPRSSDGVWVSSDATRALVVAQTRAPGYDLDAQEADLNSVRAAFAATAAGRDVHLTVTGPGVFSVTTRDRIRGDATRFSLIATALIVVLLLFLYRSPRVVLLGLLPVVTGALAGIAAVSLGFGSVHGITLGFGVTLIGEGVDYAIYLFTQIAPGTNAKGTLDRIWPTLRLGVLTSICGFSAMLFAGFPGLAQLGLFSIAGLIVAVGVTRFVLPGLLPAGFSARAVTRFAPAVNRLAQRAPLLRLPLFLVVAVGAVMLVLHHGPLLNGDLASLSPVPRVEQDADSQLRADIGAPDVRHLVVINGKDRESALLQAEKVAPVLSALRDQGVLASFDSPAAILPSASAQRLRQAALPDGPVLRANLARAQDGLDFRANSFEGFLEDVGRARAQPLLERSTLGHTKLALRFDTLLIARGVGFAAMMPLHGVTDADAITRALTHVEGGDVTVVDLKRESDHLYQSYVNDVVLYALLGVAAIVLLLLATLRSLVRVGAVLAPLAAAVIITAAVMTFGDARLSLFHLVGLLLVVAVGSNYSLFFDRQVAQASGRERTVVSLAFANLATVIGFGILSLSKVPVLNAIGSTVGLGAVLCLVFSAVLVPRQGGRQDPSATLVNA